MPENPASDPSTADRIEYLSQYLTQHKRDIMAGVLENRTRHVSIVLENIYQPHNASACMRSSDCLGLQDVHVIENRNQYRPNTNVAMGASKWLDLHQHRDTKKCLTKLKADGFRIVATTPNKDGYDPTNVPLDQPIALMFGTEELGLTPEALEMADDSLCLPMYGFTQSYNISVTVAITLSRIIERLHAGEIGDLWKLDPVQCEEILLSWYRRVVTRHDLLESRHFGE